MKISEQQVKDWVGGYVTAWRSTDPKDIAALFADDGESHEWPYETAWLGLDAIIRGGQSRAAWDMPLELDLIEQRSFEQGVTMHHYAIR